MTEVTCRDWRCTKCGRKLGHIADDRLVLRIGRRYQYLAGLPACCVCPKCQTLNVFPDDEPSAEEARVVGS